MFYGDADGHLNNSPDHIVTCKVRVFVGWKRLGRGFTHGNTHSE